MTEFQKYVYTRLHGIERSDLTAAELKIAQKLIKLGFCFWDTDDINEQHLQKVE